MVNWNVNTATDRQEQREFDGEPIPGGIPVDFYITNAESKPTSKGGEMIVIETTIDGGPYANRKMWNNINVVCPGSEQAEAIGRGQVVAILDCVGWNGQEFGPESLPQLIGQHGSGRTKIEKGTDGYADKTVIGTWLAKGSAAPAPQPKPASAPVKPAASPGNPFART